MLEAICGRCGETFIPHDENDTEHGWSEDQRAVCGGEGTITGEWFYGQLVPRRD